MLLGGRKYEAGWAEIIVVGDSFSLLTFGIFLFLRGSISQSRDSVCIVFLIFTLLVYFFSLVVPLFVCAALILGCLYNSVIGFIP